MIYRTSLLLLALAVVVPAHAGKHYIAGRIIDRNGDPIDQAIITLHPTDPEEISAQLVTDKEGRFLVDYLRQNDGERARLSKRADYKLEVFKPGFHTKQVGFFYKKGEMRVETLTMTEDTIVVHDDKANLDPNAYDTRTQSSGATYEGQ
ncbi:MAG: hypothetical protein ACI9MC_002444 [Kiritimatiellia bacterium]|jgi:hypothetical protein